MTKRSIKKYLYHTRSLKELHEFTAEKLESAIPLAFDEIDPDMASRLELRNRGELRRLLLLGQEKGWVAEPGTKVDYAYAKVKAAIEGEDKSEGEDGSEGNFSL